MKLSEAYFLAKRQVQDSLAGRIEVLNEKSVKAGTDMAQIEKIAMEIEIVEKLRNHLRNSMLWDTTLGE